MRLTIENSNGLVSLLALAGMLGFVFLMPWLIEIRVALGRRTQGLGEIVVDTALGAVALLIALFVLILVVAVGILARDTVPWALSRLVLGIIFAVFPYITYRRLAAWRSRVDREASESVGSTVDKAIG